jgi:lysophospholipase L1-like esterase
MSTEKQIILIGDSLTEWNFKENGWGKKLQDWYGEKATIINEGYAGYNSKMIKEIIHQIIPKKSNKQELLICTILLGTNDCFFQGRQISFQDYKLNILYIVDYIHLTNQKTEILLITPPISVYQKAIAQYINALYEIKKERNFINIVNLHHNPHAIIVLTDLYDGIHINDSGNDKLFKNVQNSIFYHYNSYTPSKL